MTNLLLNEGSLLRRWVEQTVKEVKYRRSSLTTSFLVQSCLFINEMFQPWASDVDFANTPLPHDYVPQRNFLPIDWLTLTHFSCQQWHLSPTSALVEQESLPWQCTRTHFYKKKLSLSLWVFLWVFQFKDKEFWLVNSGGSIRLAVFGRCNDNASIVTAEKWFPTISIFIDAPNCK